MGELLVEYGELAPDALDAILTEQRQRYRPFGRIAAQRYGVPPTAIWRAWAEQYARYCPHIDLSVEPIDRTALNLLDSRLAWRQRLLPLRWHDGDLVLVTCPHRLPAVLQFVDESFAEPAVAWLTSSIHALEDTLRAAYPGCDRAEAA